MCTSEPLAILAVQVAVLRLLQQLGQVYSVMKIDSLKALVPFMNFGEVEAVIVDAVKNEFIQVSAVRAFLLVFCQAPLLPYGWDPERRTDSLPASIRGPSMLNRLAASPASAVRQCYS